MRNAGEHTYSTFDVRKRQPSPHIPVLTRFSNLPSKTAKPVPSWRKLRAGLHRLSSPWPSRHTRPCTCAMPHQQVEKCESPRTGSATRAALAQAVPSRMTAVRRSGSPHLGSTLPPYVGRRCTCALPHQRVEKPKVGKLPAPSRHRSPTLSHTVRGHGHTPAAVSRWSKNRSRPPPAPTCVQASSV